MASGAAPAAAPAAAGATVSPGVLAAAALAFALGAGAFVLADASTEMPLSLLAFFVSLRLVAGASALFSAGGVGESSHPCAVAFEAIIPTVVTTIQRILSLDIIDSRTYCAADVAE